MKRLAILGSTGSIGQSTLKVARHLNEQIQIVALAARENIDILEQQALEFQPSLIAVYDTDKARELKKRLPHFQILAGMEGLLAVASYDQADLVISAIAGTMGLQPTLAGIQAGKQIGLANKEALVSGGELVIRLAKEKEVSLLPIDSEHNAIFQCLNGEHQAAVQRLILTASGGPFRSYTDEQLDQVTASHALKHPTWAMGPKVTIDSSTLMNKGLEVIEAHWLFGVHVEHIDVVIHPQSIIHSMVEFQDGSLMAQMGEPTMMTPIQYAITYPKRYPGVLKPFDFLKNANLQFFIPDKAKFRCLRLAYEAIGVGGSLPCYMNAANEVLVDSFLKGKISWKEIGTRLEALMLQHHVVPIDSLDTVLAIDAVARQEAAIRG
jgi:1-deoxy-D-xylulose-5-phosphate reductoisomerase